MTSASWPRWWCWLSSDATAEAGSQSGIAETRGRSATRPLTAWWRSVSSPRNTGSVGRTLSLNGQEGRAMRLREHDLVWREIDGEIVLLDLASSKYLMINKTGTFLLQLLATERDQE